MLDFVAGFVVTTFLAQSPRRSLTDCQPVSRGGVVRCERSLTGCQSVNRGRVIRCQRPSIRSRSRRRPARRSRPIRSNE